MKTLDITNIIQNSIKTNHRALFVLKNTNIIQEIYNQLCINSISSRPLLLHLFKNKCQDILPQRQEFVEKTKFSESDKILGNTFSMLLIQDLQDISPNLLAKSVETIKGGGIICFIVDFDINDIANKIFCKRLLKSLTKSKNVFFFDEKNHIIEKCKKRKKLHAENQNLDHNKIKYNIGSSQKELSNLQDDLSSKNTHYLNLQENHHELEKNNTIFNFIAQNQSEQQQIKNNINDYKSFEIFETCLNTENVCESDKEMIEMEQLQKKQNENSTDLNFERENNFINEKFEDKTDIQMKKIKISDTKHNKIELIEKNDVACDKREEISKKIHSKEQKNKTLRDEIEEHTLAGLFSLSKTNDQLKVLENFSQILTERSFKTVCSLNAARGRGKSAVLGLGIALALHCSFSTIFIAAPCLENIKTVFEFVVIGLKGLGYESKVHFDVISTSINRIRLVHKIIFRKRFIRQEVSYFNPTNDLKILPDLMVIDEAASVPLPRLNKLLLAKLVLMASTVDGYEGTGRVLALKLFSELEKKSKDPKNPFLFRRLALNTPIRYSFSDPIEEWLNSALLLYGTPSKIPSFPDVKNCSLYLVNREILFSGKAISESFLEEIVSLFGAAHYRNSPDDLLAMADNQSMFVYVLCENPNEGQSELPKVICAIQIVNEKVVGNNKAGNLTPQCLFENYQIDDCLNLKGIRIVRIAVHPDLQRLGYGGKAVNLLMTQIHESNSKINNKNHKEKIHLENNNSIIPNTDLTKFDKFQFKSYNGEENSETKIKFEEKLDDYTDNKNIIDLYINKTMEKSLLIPIQSSEMHFCDYISASFGATSSLIAFWKKLDFFAVHIKAHYSLTTGEYSALYMKPFSQDKLISKINDMFRKKFIFSLSTLHKNLDYTLCMNLFYHKNLEIQYKNYDLETDINQDIKNHLLLFIRGRAEYRHIIHIIMILAKNYFLGHYKVILSPIELSILLLLGLQCRSYDDLYKILDIEKYRVSSKLLSCMTKLYECLV